MSSIFLIRQGRLADNGVSSKWDNSFVEGYFTSVQEAEKYLSDKDYECDHDNVYFLYDDEFDITKIAEIVNFDKIVVADVLP